MHRKQKKTTESQLKSKVKGVLCKLKKSDLSGECRDLIMTSMSECKFMNNKK